MLNLKKRFESIEISVKEDPDMERKSLSLTVGKKTYKTDAKKLNSITPPERKPLCSDLDL
jgi:hypothetical protein